MADLDPRGILQLRRETGKHEPALAVGPLLAGLLGGAKIPAAGNGDDPDGDECKEGAGLMPLPSRGGGCA